MWLHLHGILDSRKWLQMRLRNLLRCAVHRAGADGHGSSGILDQPGRQCVELGDPYVYNENDVAGLWPYAAAENMLTVAGNSAVGRRRRGPC